MAYIIAEYNILGLVESKLRTCQPIKYVLFGFAKRTGSFGPMGRSTGHPNTPAADKPYNALYFASPEVLGDSLEQQIESL